MSMVNGTLVRSYAGALFAAAEKAGVLDTVAAQAKNMVELLEGEPKLRTFLEAPNIPRERKESLIEKVFGEKFHVLTVRFLRMIIRRGRVGVLHDSMEAFQTLYAKHLGITPATIATARSLADEDKERLEKALNDYTNLKLTIDYKVDEDLIGGVRFLCGDLLIDSALSSQLTRLRHDLLHTKVY